MKELVFRAWDGHIIGMMTAGGDIYDWQNKRIGVYVPSTYSDGQTLDVYGHRVGRGNLAEMMVRNANQSGHN